MIKRGGEEVSKRVKEEKRTPLFHSLFYSPTLLSNYDYLLAGLVGVGVCPTLLMPSRIWVSALMFWSL